MRATASAIRAAGVRRPRVAGAQDGAAGIGHGAVVEMLFISIKTVHRHRANLLHKRGLRDRLELTRYATRAGLIDP